MNKKIPVDDPFWDWLQVDDGYTFLSRRCKTIVIRMYVVALLITLYINRNIDRIDPPSHVIESQE